MKSFWTILFVGIVSLVSCKKEAEVIEPTTEVFKTLEDLETEKDYKWEANVEKLIILKDNSAEIVGSGVDFSQGNLKISAPGTYRISGKLSNGQIIVQSAGNDIVRLILNGVEVHSDKGSSLFIDKAERVLIFLEKGTVNNFSDNENYLLTQDGQNATIYSQTFTIVDGEGVLNVKSNFEDGLSSKDGLLIRNGKIKVDAKDEAIRGKDFVVIRGGEFDLIAGGDALKSDNEVNRNSGFIEINDGLFDITAKGDGISAYSKVNINGGVYNIKAGGGFAAFLPNGNSAKGIKAENEVNVIAKQLSLNCADDAIHSNSDLRILGGEYKVQTGDDAFHGDNSLTIENCKITVLYAFEGFEAKTINIGAGKYELSTLNDCISASSIRDSEQNDGSYVYIKNGTLILRSTSGDLLDSNGNVEMSGGTMIMHGPISAEVPLDYNGTFRMIAGLIIASGSNSRFLQAPSAISPQNSVLINFKKGNEAGKLINISNAKGESLVTFRPQINYFSFIFSSSKLIKGGNFTVSTGGLVVGTAESGYYETGVYKDGTVNGNFTVNAVITQLNL
ncbi:carbohydrate-binding domain-containing protein [Lacihabitans soyangensis]|uniref:Carbohydrate-binding domain-containing protein n=1 Tax=Lacihabitans soyangensis TaxID=869394 RepID=A0AAE3H4G2_9BACT|nr:carbohydrate-binding domain-containing protein [Lacihabitans soyangensis]MCP9764583.1 carbohydrate-binding domain-containing protein [Lacihabitans soyangensis]